MEMAAITVERTEKRNARMIRTAKTSPSPPSTARSWIDCSIEGAWSKTVLKVVPEPIERSRSGSRSPTAWEISTASASLSLSTVRLSAGRPSWRATVVESTEVTATVAKVFSGTGPSAVAIGQFPTDFAEPGALPTSMASSVSWS